MQARLAGINGGDAEASTGARISRPSPNWFENEELTVSGQRNERMMRELTHRLWCWPCLPLSYFEADCLHHWAVLCHPCLRG